MVLILDGNSEIGAQVGNNICNLICLRHLFISRTVTNQIFFSRTDYFFLHACATCFELPSKYQSEERTLRRDNPYEFEARKTNLVYQENSLAGI